MPADSMPGTNDLSRRRVLSVSGSAVLVSSVLGAPAEAETPRKLSDKQGAMVLQVARVCAAYPMPFPAFGESEPATARATLARLQAAERRLVDGRPAHVATGADALIATRLLGAGQAKLLDAIAKQAAEATAPELGALVAAVALAISTLSAHFDPNTDHAAQAWIGGLRILHQRGKQPRRLRRARIR